MDSVTKRSYIQVYLARARDDLLTARDDLAHDHWRGAVNRAYYAVFHAASAALLWLDIERARHSGVQAAFGEFLIKPELVEPSSAEYMPGRVRSVKNRTMTWMPFRLPKAMQSRSLSTLNAL